MTSFDPDFDPFFSLPGPAPPHARLPGHPALVWRQRSTTRSGDRAMNGNGSRFTQGSTDWNVYFLSMFCINNRNISVSNFDSYAFVVLFWQKKTMRLSGYFMGYYMGNIKNKVDISAIYVQAMPMLGNHWGMGHWNICHGICGIYIYIKGIFNDIFMKSPTISEIAQGK